jgi:RNA polymerase sigma-70 factor (ECF subfamily)
MVLEPSDPACADRDRGVVHSATTEPATFDSVYRAYAPFVWRSACRLGVPRSAAEDVMQEVFLIVHRRLDDFEERTSLRAWLSAILVRVVRTFRRSARRKDPMHRERLGSVDTNEVTDSQGRSPHELAERDEAVRELYAILSQMSDDRREVFVLAELEQLTAPEIGEALQMNLNTVYWKLRMARGDFERILLRRRASEARSNR